jgi:hypothetical protein
MGAMLTAVRSQKETEMIEITHAEYSSLCLMPLSNEPLTTERRWFKHGERLGIVLIDNTDHDWSFVALSVQKDFHRAYDVGTSYPTEHAAMQALERTLKGVP